MILNYDISYLIHPLPKKYAKISLGTTAILQVPTGDEWKVAITRDASGTNWFTGQWKEFYAFFSISLGHFLTFNHNGNSHFSVTIFDMSTCEIEYPIYIPGTDNAREDFNTTPGSSNTIILVVFIIHY
ncbi:B3 domain-containing protein At1g49475 [Linum perenne]